MGSLSLRVAYRARAEVASKSYGSCARANWPFAREMHAHVLPRGTNFTHTACSDPASKLALCPDDAIPIGVMHTGDSWAPRMTPGAAPNCTIDCRPHSERCEDVRPTHIRARSSVSAAETTGLSASSSANALQSTEHHVQELSDQHPSRQRGAELGHMVLLVCTSNLPISSTPASSPHSRSDQAEGDSEFSTPPSSPRTIDYTDSAHTGHKPPSWCWAPTRAASSGGQKRKKNLIDCPI